MRGHLKSACYKRQLDDVNIANACFDTSVVRMWAGGGGGGGGGEMKWSTCMKRDVPTCGICFHVDL